MKLKTYNAQNASRRRSGKPAISFSTKGVICINKWAAEALNLAEGETVSFSQDEENVLDWYLHKDPNGLTLRQNSTGGLLANSALICEDIRACLREVDETKTATLILVPEAVVVKKVEYYPILTASAR